MFRDEKRVSANNGRGVQGDVPVVLRPEGPRGDVEELKTAVVRAGEITGHNHTLVPTITTEPQFRVVREKETSQLWVELFANVSAETPVHLMHQDHNTVTFEKEGWYFVPEQVEYDGRRERRVLD